MNPTHKHGHSHGHVHALALLDTSNESRYAASKRVTWASVYVNLFLTVLQVVIGFIGNSQALIADGFHTLSDLVTDFMVLFALKHSAKAADARHPYGHARIETAVTLLLGGILVAVGIGIAANAGLKLLRAETFTIPSTLTLWVAVFTLVSKEFLYRYLMAVAERFDSNLLRANAWHSRSDAISSLVVVAGIGGALLGFGYLDSIAAAIVAAMVVKVGVGLSWDALGELIDTGLEPEDVERLRESILSVNGVRALHLLRTRRIGGRAIADVHIIVGDKLSVSEGHQISETVRSRLMKEVGAADAMVHIDIEDDVEGASGARLPLRDEIEQRLNGYFHDIPQSTEIEHVTLHYLNGKLDIELVLPFRVAVNLAEARQLADRFRAAVMQDADINDLDVRFH
jgi:cation diffusion facilitator family transporter